MTKALEILKNLTKLELSYMYEPIGSPKLKELNEAIKELEAMCETCKFNGTDNGESWQEGYNQAKRELKATQNRTCDTCKGVSDENISRQ